jgi:hypothetical protein
VVALEESLVLEAADEMANMVADHVDSGDLAADLHTQLSVTGRALSA